jgi:hypothetical protein
MKEFTFDNRDKLGHANDNRKNGNTVHGAIQLFPGFQVDGVLSLDIRGPQGAFRGSASITRETARAVGLALVKWGWGGEVLFTWAGSDNWRLP